MANREGQNMIRRQVYLTQKEIRALTAISRATGLTVSDHVRRAIDRYVAATTGAGK